MRMFGAAVNLELGEQAAAEPVLREHPAHGGLDQALGLRVRSILPAEVVRIPPG